MREGENVYLRTVKPMLDIVFSGFALIVLSPVFLILSVLVFVDDPGPVFFTQKRVGKNKTFFKLHKFRSMKMSTPSDVPTHQLTHPEQYITRVGKVLRKYSLDELPQIWDIFRGRMSIVGPRPALWNQRDLVKERDKYGANDLLPGLTGLAQVSGRDELEIPVKARYDGKYAAAMRRGGLSAFFMDVRCFFKTFSSALGAEGVVEGGTGEMHRTQGAGEGQEKRVLILANHVITITSYRLELVKRLVEEGYEVHLSCPAGEHLEELTSLPCIHHLTEVNRRGMNPVQELQLLRAYRKLMKEVKPDVVLGYTIKCNIYGAIAARHAKVPFIANITGLGAAVENGGKTRMLVSLMYRYAFRGIHRVFCQNEMNRHFFSDQGIAVDALKLLPGSGVNLDHFALMPYPGCGDGVTGAPAEFVYVGRIMEEKGVEVLVQAATRVKEHHPQTVFHACGFREEGYRGAFDEAVEKGIIAYHGMVSDIREILRSVHCVIQPSIGSEGINNAILEGASSGRPVITTDRPGCRETVDDGVTGFLVPVKDVDALTDAIERFLALSYEKKRAMGLAGRRKMEQSFDRQTVVDIYMEEIAECFRERR